jgi:glycosyltransferase involved in cell wall biosynthesis
MKVSIVVPTFNQGKYITECLKSIYTQTYRDIEVIIQDSLSNDGTEAICNKYTKMDPRFRYCREKDSGQSDAINRGLAESSGQLWTWICSDDRYNNSRAVAKLVDAFVGVRASGKAAVGAFGRAFFMDEAGAITGPYPQMNTDIKREDLQMDWPLAQPASILLRQRVLDVGGLVTALRLGMDLDLFIKMLEGGRRFVYLDHPVADVRLHPDSKSVKLRVATALTAMYIVQEHFGPIVNLSKSRHAENLHCAFDGDSEEVNHLKSALRESEADRAARLDQIQQLTELLRESEADRAARLDQIQQLAELLRESEADRAARLDQIQQLAELLRESEADRALRSEQIEILTKYLRELTCAFEGLRSSSLYWLLSMSSFIKSFERVLRKIQSEDGDPPATIS